MKTTATVGERGQVTIPKKLRDRLGITPGTRLEFKQRSGTLVLTRHLDDYRARLQSVIGILPPFDVDAFLRETRGRDGADWYDPPHPALRSAAPTPASRNQAARARPPKTPRTRAARHS